MKSKEEAVMVRSVPPRISRVRKQAVMVRWESVKLQREDWLKPFYKLPIERAMVYLEDLRQITVNAANIMNSRLGNDPNKMRCACGCGKDLSGTQPNGRPLWISKRDFK